MVGRSKPQKRMERPTSVDFSIAEITYLKAKNVELAKALADSKAAYAQMFEDRNLTQRELFEMTLRCTKLEKYIKNMESASRSCMGAIVMASNHATELLQNAHNALRVNMADDTIHNTPSKSLNGSAYTPPVPSKTQAVKPMIGGHVILRPTINLRRVNEIPFEEIQRLQSGSQSQNAGHGNLENNGSSNDGDQTQDDSPPPRVRIFRARQQPIESLIEPFGNIGGEDEYTDQISDISDPSEENNGLDTVQEEHEDELTTENHRNSLTNTNNTSLSLSSSSSQVPLLSGVFRDVRVYLSPMPNVTQQLDPRQHVTTERGSNKSHKPKRSQSLHSGRSTENVPRSSSKLGENRNALAPNINSNNTAQNQSNNTATTSSDSLEDSFTATLHNSPLSSTRISTPNHRRTAVSKPNDLNWLDTSNGYGGSSQSQSGNTGSSNATNSKYVTLRQKHTRNGFVSKTPDTSRSFSASGSKYGPSTSDDDPLEGPSNLLDSMNNYTKNKIETMSGLGLTPTFTIDNSKRISEPPPSPARTVLQRRERRKSDEKMKKSLYVTKRTAIEKKKAAVISTKVAKVVIKRLSLTKTRHSESPSKSLDGSQRKSSLDSSQRRRSLNTSERNKNTTNKKEESTLNSRIANSDNSAASSRDRSLSTEKLPLRKRSRNTRRELAGLEVRIEKSVSPDSPKKKVRPKRHTSQISLKEPSLRKKLRNTNGIK